MLQIFRALSAVLALFAIALGSALITMRLAIHGAEVHVPALSGLTMPDAMGLLHARGLQAGIDGHFYSTTQPAGYVLTQSPAPGTLVRKSWRVRLTQSLGPQKVAIPAVEGMDESMATITIRSTGLKVGNVVAMPYAYAPENTTIAQTPLAHATDVQEPKVSILTAQPAIPPDDGSVMPDLTGDTFTTAAFTIMHAGFKLAPLSDTVATIPASTQATSQTSATNSTGPPPAAASPLAAPLQTFVPSGTVIAQVPNAGTRILAGATIQLTVQP